MMARMGSFLMLAKVSLLIWVNVVPFTDVRTGVVVHTGSRKICIQDRHERDMQLYPIYATCRVTLDELPAALDDLKSGDAVTLTFSAGNDRKVRKFEAYSAPFGNDSGHE